MPKSILKIPFYLQLLFAALLAFTVNTFIYFGYANVYSNRILDLASFQDQFHTGIYQYRILSAYLLVGVYDLLSFLNIDFSLFKLKFLNPGSEPQLYVSFYILNTFFLVLFAIMFLKITQSRNFAATAQEKILLMSIAVFTIALSQFVIVPYDISSYFLLAVFFYFLQRFLGASSMFNLMILGGIMFVSTVNRETSALSLSVAAVLLFEKFRFKKSFIQPLVFLTALFFLTYAGLRYFGSDFTTNDGNVSLQNFSQPKNILGILFWAVFFALSFMLAQNHSARKNIIIFHIISLPYILVCFYTGILYEIRLYLPLFLTSLLLCRREIARID